MSAKCSATTKAGDPCRFYTDAESGLCISHDPAQADALRQRAGRGGKVRVARHHTKRTECSLRTLEDIRSFVEAAALDALNSKGDVLARANAQVKIAQLALEMLKAGQLDSENKELRELLIKHFPEAKRLLKAVP